jgi:hypothetical protein
MRAREFLKLIFEAAAGPTAIPGDPALDPLYNLKLVVANKIKDLPPDPATEQALHEIEDMLASVGAGTKTEVVGKELQKINDVDVNAAQRLLAKYIYSLDASPADKKSMLAQWATDDGLIDLGALLNPGKNTVASVVKGYEKNPAIKELTDDLAQVAALGQGKGEFLLSVFSKRITKAKKGDLNIDKFGQVEVKTTDGGAGRFTDQQVRPSASYQQSVNDFFKTFNETLTTARLKSSTGVNIDQLVALKDALPVEQRDLFKEKLAPKEDLKRRRVVKTMKMQIKKILPIQKSQMVKHLPKFKPLVKLKQGAKNSHQRGKPRRHRGNHSRSHEKRRYHQLTKELSTRRLRRECRLIWM